MITIHQTETRNLPEVSREHETAVLRSILRHHQNTDRSNNEGKRWGDIAYHYLIGPSGEIYRGRDLRFQSDSATILRDELRGNLTVCLLGDFRTREEKAGDRPPVTTPDQLPTEAALESLTSLIAWELHRNALGVGAVKAHRDLKMIKGGSDCPGGLVYLMMRSQILPSIQRRLGVPGER